MWTRPVDAPDRIDLLWLLTYRPEARPPDDEAARESFEARAAPALREREAKIPFHDPGASLVYPRFLAAAAPAAEVALTAFALSAVAGAILWWRNLRAARVDAVDGPGAEGLLRLYDAAGAYLAVLRDLVVASVLVLLAVALHVQLDLGLGSAWSMLRSAGIGTLTGPILGVALLATYAVTFAVWAYAGWSAARAVRGFRERRARPPLDAAPFPE